MPNLLRQLLLMIGLVIAVGGLLWFGASGEPAKGGSFAAAGVLMMLASRFDQLASVKVAGVLEAELKQTVHEAKMILDQIRDLAVTLTDPLLRQSMSAGRMDVALGPAEGLRVQNEVERMLERMGVDKAKIAPLRRHYEWFTLVDLCHVALELLQKFFREKQAVEHEAIKQKFGNPITDNEGHTSAWQTQNALEAARRSCLDLLRSDHQEEFRRDPDQLELQIRRSCGLTTAEAEALLDSCRPILDAAKMFARSGAFLDLADLLNRYPRLPRAQNVASRFSQSQ